MFKRFISYYKPYKGMFFLDMLASLFIAIIGMGYPILTNTVLKEIVPSTEILNDKKINFIIIFAICLLALCTVTYFRNRKAHQ